MAAFTCVCTAVHSVYDIALTLVTTIFWQQAVAAVRTIINVVYKAAPLGFRAYFGMYGQVSIPMFVP